MRRQGQCCGGRNRELAGTARGQAPVRAGFGKGLQGSSGMEGSGSGGSARAAARAGKARERRTVAAMG